MLSASKRLRLNSVGLQQQQLSYRKQIARQLRTQHVERICNNPVTLKYRLRPLKVTGNDSLTKCHETNATRQNAAGKSATRTKCHKRVNVKPLYIKRSTATEIWHYPAFLTLTDPRREVLTLTLTLTLTITYRRRGS